MLHFDKLLREICSEPLTSSGQNHENKISLLVSIKHMPTILISTSWQQRFIIEPTEETEEY